MFRIQEVSIICWPLDPPGTGNAWSSWRLPAYYHVNIQSKRRNTIAIVKGSYIHNKYYTYKLPYAPQEHTMLLMKDIQPASIRKKWSNRV